jgi:hypothetical protein
MSSGLRLQTGYGHGRVKKLIKVYQAISTDVDMERPNMAEKPDRKLGHLDNDA